MKLHSILRAAALAGLSFATVHAEVVTIVVTTAQPDTSVLDVVSNSWTVGSNSPAFSPEVIEDPENPGTYYYRMTYSVIVPDGSGGRECYLHVLPSGSASGGYTPTFQLSTYNTLTSQVEAFSLSSAPDLSSAPSTTQVDGDLNIGGSIDAHGVRLNLGALLDNPSLPTFGIETGTQQNSWQTYDNSWNVPRASFVGNTGGEYTAYATAYDPGSGTQPGFLWEWTTPQYGPALRLNHRGDLEILGNKLTLGASHEITLQNISGHLLLNGQPVVDQTYADNNYLRIASFFGMFNAIGDPRYVKVGTAQNRIAFGTGSTVGSDHAFAFGKNDTATGVGATAFGDHVYANGSGAIALGSAVYNGTTFVTDTRAVGRGAIALGYGSWSTAEGSIAGGWRAGATASGSVALGTWAYAGGQDSAAIGGNTNYALGIRSITIGGWGNHAYGADSIALAGDNNTINGRASVGVGEGNSTGADAFSSVAMGYQNQVLGLGAFAVGGGNLVDTGAWFSSALGANNTIQYSFSTALGHENFVGSYYSIVGGNWNRTTPEARNTHLFGTGLKSIYNAQFIVGRYNAYDDSLESDIGTANRPGGRAAAFIVGAGSQWNDLGTEHPTERAVEEYLAPNAIGGDPAGTVRKNAFVVRWNGDTEAAGNVVSKAAAGLNLFNAPIRLSSTGSLQFDDGTGTPLTLARSGSSLRIGTAAILTEGTGDSRYLQKSDVRLQIGSGSIVGSDYAFAVGKDAYATGVGSTAFGSNVAAAGVGAVALGVGVFNGSGGVEFPARAFARGAVSLGEGNQAMAVDSSALGLVNTTEGPQSFAAGWGNYTHSTANQSFALGALNDVIGNGGMAMGYQNYLKAGGYFSAAIGLSNSVDGPGTVVLGAVNNVESGFSVVGGLYNHTPSVARNTHLFGVGLDSNSTAQFIVGRYNALETVADPYLSADGSAPAFIIGSGYQTDSDNHELAINAYHGPDTNLTYPAGTNIVRKNAFVVRWNGDTEVTGNVISKAATGTNTFNAPITAPSVTMTTAAVGAGIDKHPDTQVVVGRYNNTLVDDTSERTKGVFVVGAGSSNTVRKNAMRILDDGSVLVQQSGDVSMGEFQSGEQP